MAYTPINWQTGDTITAEKMNKMDNGWGMSSTQLFSESVTTEDTGEGYSVGELTYSTLISAPVIKVTFDGTQYECAYEDTHYGAPWSDSAGAYDFSVYPFGIDSYSTPIGISNEVITETDGTHTISIGVESIEVSGSFDTVVNEVVDHNAVPIVIGETTWQEVYDAVSSGKMAYHVEKDGNTTAIIKIASYVGQNSRGDYIVNVIYYDGSDIAIETLTASSADSTFL